MNFIQSTMACHSLGGRKELRAVYSCFLSATWQAAGRISAFRPEIETTPPAVAAPSPNDRAPGEVSLVDACSGGFRLFRVIQRAGGLLFRTSLAARSPPVRCAKTLK